MYEYILTHIISKFKKTTWAARASNMEVSSETWQEEEKERLNISRKTNPKIGFGSPEIYIRTVLP